MKKFLLSLLMLSGIYSHAQTDTVFTEDKQGYLSTPVIELLQSQGYDNINQVDSLLNYRITIPKWWKIRDTANRSFFGGTFPAVEGIENALLLKSFSKDDFTGIEDFEGWVIKNYNIGDMPKWSNQHKILLKKPIEDFKTIGHAYFVQLMREGKIYHCCYIVAETPDTFLWIDFTATQETYAINFEKLKSLLSGFSIIKP